MRIYFVNDRFDPKRSEGTKAHVEELTQELIRAGHEVWSPPESPNQFSSKLASSRWQRLRQILGMKAFYIRVCAGDLPRPLPLRTPFRQILAPHVVWELNATLEYAMQSGSHWTAERVWEKELARAQAAQSVSLAICNSEGLARYANCLGVRNTVVVPLGADPERFRPEVPPSRDIPRRAGVLNVLWVGTSQYWWHDLNTALTAAHLLESDPRFHFFLVGDLPANLALRRNVTPLGRRRNEEMPGLQAASDVGLVLYREARQPYCRPISSPRESGSPIKLFEFMASGLVVLASPLEQVERRIIQHGRNGFMVPFEEADALRQTLLDLADHPGNLGTIRSEARRSIVEYYNWRRVAQETGQALSTVCT